MQIVIMSDFLKMSLPRTFIYREWTVPRTSLNYSYQPTKATRDNWLGMLLFILVSRKTSVH